MSSVLEITKCDISNFRYYDNVTEYDGRKLEERQKDREVEILKEEMDETENETTKGRKGKRERESESESESEKERVEGIVVKKVFNNKTTLQSNTATQYEIIVNSTISGDELLSRLNQSLANGNFLSTLNDKTDFVIQSVQTFRLVLVLPGNESSPTLGPSLTSLSISSPQGR